jgi:hypothetical protein
MGLVSEIHSHNHAENYNRADNAANSVGANVGAEKSYFESLRLGHEISPLKSCETTRQLKLH